MITRNNPEVGYLDPAAFEALGFCQVVRAGSTVYLSGVAPLKGAPPEFELVGLGSMEEQITFILDVLERCLATEGLTLDNVVSVTTYVTNIEAYLAAAPILAKRFGGGFPASTLLGVTGLAHPDQLVEVTATAVD